MQVLTVTGWAIVKKRHSYCRETFVNGLVEEFLLMNLVVIFAPGLIGAVELPLIPFSCSSKHPSMYCIYAMMPAYPRVLGQK